MPRQALRFFLNHQKCDSIIAYSAKATADYYVVMENTVLLFDIIMSSLFFLKKEMSKIDWIAGGPESQLC